MKINFFGDFVSNNDCRNLSISRDLANIINCADINIVNFEAPVVSDKNILSKAIEKSGPSLHQGIESVTWLKKNGFNMAAIANNHIMDYGDDGLISTLKAFAEVPTIGAGCWQQAYKPYIISLKGQKIAFFSFVHNEFGVLRDKWDMRYNYGTAWINHQNIDKLIVDTKSKVDKLFIFAHAGVEYLQQPLPEWRERYKAFIDWGCDGVIASHPHIIQGWEFYKCKPIVYSLGNFYFPKFISKDKYWYRSLCVSITCGNDGVSLDVKPVIFNESEIKIDNSKDIYEYLQQINNVLSDDNLYMSYINDACIKKLAAYYDLFEAGGLVGFKPMKYIKNTVKKIVGKNISKPVHLINNLWCESHRYCICRALKITENIR